MRMQSFWASFQAVSVAGALALSGCASIPRQSAELSGALHSQLEDMRVKHVALVNKYFGEVEARVRSAILNDYKDALVQAMRERLREKGKDLTTEQYDQIVSRVLTKMDQALKDLERDRSEVLGEVTERYVLMTSEAQAIHGLLVSATKLEESRKKITGAVEERAEAGVKYLQSVDNRVQGYLNEVEKVKGGLKKIKSDVEEVLDGQPR